MTPVFFSATLLCLSKIVYEYNSYLETEVLDQILEIVVALMESKQREILKGVIAFIKVIIKPIWHLEIFSFATFPFVSCC